MLFKWGKEVVRGAPAPRVSAHVLVHTEMLSRGICCRATLWPWLCGSWWQLCVSWSLEWKQACREWDEGPEVLRAGEVLLPLLLRLPEMAQLGSEKKLGHHTPIHLSSDKTVSSVVVIWKVSVLHPSGIRPCGYFHFFLLQQLMLWKRRSSSPSSIARAHFLCFCLHLSGFPFCIHTFHSLDVKSIKTDVQMYRCAREPWALRVSAHFQQNHNALLALDNIGSTDANGYWCFGKKQSTWLIYGHLYLCILTKNIEQRQCIVQVWQQYSCVRNMFE